MPSSLRKIPQDHLAVSRPWQSQPGSPVRRWIIWFLLAGITYGCFGSVGIAGGYWSGIQEYRRREIAQGVYSIQQQYELGLQDYYAGRYDLAKQRFEYVLEQDPGFPGAEQRLSETLQILYATATPSPLPPTPTLTPTPDLRPVEELFVQSAAEIAAGNWDRAIDLLQALRKVDPIFRVADVDGMLYLAHRYRGVSKINEQGILEGGIYDLALAERFGPLDAEANSLRDLARLYMIGSGFWEVYPEQAAFYFGQVAAAAPHLRDASGWTAFERYRMSLVHMADRLARQGDWCSAQAQYEVALAVCLDQSIQATASYAALKCSPPTDTPLPPSETPTATLQGTTIVPTSTSPLIPSPTWTSTLSPTEQTTTIPSITPTISTPGLTETPTPPPSPTPSETLPIPPSETPTSPPEPPTPTATETSPGDAPLVSVHLLQVASHYLLI